MSSTSDNHLHVVSFDVPWPANYGGVIDVYYKIRSLHHKGIKVHLHAFEYGRGHQKELESVCASVSYYKRDLAKTNLFRNLPYIVCSRTSEELNQKLLADEHPILLEGLHTTMLLNDPRFASRKIAVRTHNIEHEYYRNLASAESQFLKKYYFANEARKLERYEKVLEKASGIVAISRKDAAYFGTKYPNVHFIPAFHPHQQVNILTGKGDYVLYHGNLSVNENHSAVKYLLENVFSDMDVPFVIAGLNPPRWLADRVASMPHVKLIANPDDATLAGIIRNAHIHLLITFQATGLKLKLINTLYNGRYCLVNDKMLSGSALDELCILSNGAESIKQQLKRLLRRDFTAKEIARREKKLAQLYHNGHNTDRLIDILFGQA
ncbi:MAG: glycosyltransferase family 1 protein [Bacteroidetes bacterium]|nr:glycosyltransferase family 1 protein [Bacteroidota bacterium]